MSSLLFKLLGALLKISPSRCDPDVSPDGHKIAFGYRMLLNHGLFIVNSSGEFPTRLGNDSFYCIRPCWSHDSKHIIYETIKFKKHHIEIFDFQNCSRFPLTQNNQNMFPRFSPDGKTIIYSLLNEFDGTCNLYLMSDKGLDKKPLTNFGIEDGFALYPNWSPDGKYIVFTIRRKNKYDIALLEISNFSIKLLTSDGASSMPAWSPNNEDIAFKRCASIYTMNRNGLNLKRLFSNNLLAYGPCYFPDGNRIVFSADEPENRNRKFVFDLFIINSDGKNLKKLIIDKK